MTESAVDPASSGKSAPADQAEGTIAANRRDAMVRHACRQIAEKGMQHVSVNEILRNTGGSKATIVKYFGNKDGLIAAAIEQLARESFISTDVLKAYDSSADLEQSLSSMLCTILRIYLQPQAIANYRGVIASAGSTAHVAEIFYRHGEMVVNAELAHFLSMWQGRGICEMVDVNQAADQLTHMLRGGLFDRVLLGLHPLPVADDDITRTAAAAAKLFLNGAKSKVAGD